MGKSAFCEDHRCRGLIKILVLKKIADKGNEWEKVFSLGGFKIVLDFFLDFR